MNQASEEAVPVPPSARTTEDALDEVILESFPASDPPASWSGLAQSDSEAPESGEDPA